MKDEATPQTISLDVDSILASASASLDPSMTKDQVLEIGHHLSQHNARLTRLSLNEGFRDLQDAIVQFLLLPCCSELQVLEYKAGGSSFGKIVLSSANDNKDATDSTEHLLDESFIHAHLPWTKTMKVLRLGYNSDAPQGETDILALNALLRRMPLLEEFSLAQSLDNLSLLENGVAIKKLSIAMNVECGMEQAQVEEKIRGGLVEGVEELKVEMEESESSYYLNLSRDRHFQAFLRRFGGEKKN
ncbi:hypothetical protein BGZ99_009964 [Dissophora globulifera]|uniref:Uncharacterized protein n=1 Tax=Dissophora globulifera TaxID=979702 RepID=A0A9P6RSY2_9FUNG|nr:hypothetical protein BGZ99_009964 [Dissophora globulifera]